MPNPYKTTRAKNREQQRTDTGTGARTAATAVEEEKEELARTWADAGGSHTVGSGGGILGGGVEIPTPASVPKPGAETKTTGPSTGGGGTFLSGYTPTPTRQADTATGSKPSGKPTAGGTFVSGGTSTTTPSDKQRVAAAYKGSESEKAIRQNDEQERSAGDARRYSAERNARREREKAAEENPGSGGYFGVKPSTQTASPANQTTDAGTSTSASRGSHTVGAKGGFLGGPVEIPTEARSGRTGSSGSSTPKTGPRGTFVGGDTGPSAASTPPKTTDAGKTGGETKPDSSSGRKPPSEGGRTMTVEKSSGGSGSKDKGSGSKDKGSGDKKGSGGDKGSSRHRAGYTKYKVGGRTFWVKN